MIKIYQTNESDFLIWDLEALPILQEARITYDTFGRYPDSCLPIRISVEKAEVLVHYLKIATYCRLEYCIPSVEELDAHEVAYNNELANWREERRGYDFKMRAIHTGNFEIAMEDIPQKPIMPVSIETTSARSSWCRENADPGAKRMAAQFGPHCETRCKIFLSLWLDGWWIGEGSKFGGDYLLYQESPDKCHSSYIVSVLYRKEDECALSSGASLDHPLLCYRDMMSASRLANITKKVMVFCFFDTTIEKTKFISCDWTGWN